ncbi:MAG: methyltransferase [Pseudonocardiales bacterium]
MQSENSEISPPERILQLATASWMSAAVSAVAALGVADELVFGPRSVDEIAHAVDAHAPTLYRLLRACADFELFHELDGQVFALTELGEALSSESPSSMRNFARWVGLPADRYTWSDLVTSVRTGEPVFVGVHGQPVWDYMSDHPDVGEVFDNAMTEASYQVIAPIVDAYDFSSFGEVVDVGGGHGALLAAVLAASPQTRGVLYDQPDVIAGAGGPLKEAGVSARCQLLSGDFFESVPTGGDAYLLSNIIHDWDDEHSTQILANCRAAMAADGRVLLVEAVLPDKAEPAPLIKLMDLNMLIISGGRQRTGAEFGELFRRVGLELSRIVPGGLCSVVEAVRA